MIIALSGSSCCGKNTIIKELIKQNNNLEYIKTFSSREMRQGESQGNPYYFISKQQFQEKIKNGDFLEHELIHNNFYGVDKQICIEELNKNKSLIKDMGVVGTFNLKEKLSNYLVETIFLFVSKHELKKRLKKRGDSASQIKLRLKRYKFEKKNSIKYNYIINNNNIDSTLKIMNKILQNNKNSQEYIKFSKDKINYKKVEKYKNQLINNKTFKPIKLYFNGEDFYLNKDIEKYLAGLQLNKTIAKVIIIKNKSKKLYPNTFIKSAN